MNKYLKLWDPEEFQVNASKNQTVISTLTLNNTLMPCFNHLSYLEGNMNFRLRKMYPMLKSR